MPHRYWCVLFKDPYYDQHFPLRDRGDRLPVRFIGVYLSGQKEARVISNIRKKVLGPKIPISSF